MGPITLPYDPADDLTDRAAQEELLEEAFASGDSNFIVAAVSAVSRARGVTPMIETISPASREERAPTDAQLPALLTAISALGYKLVLMPA